MENSLKQKQLEEDASVMTKTLYKGKIFNLRQDTLQLENKPPHTWDIIVHPGAVAILPICDNGNLLLIQQWRRAVGKILYEIPAGTLDANENPFTCAQRELREETGFRAEELIPFGGIHSAPGFCTEYIHFFIGKRLKEDPLKGDEHEAIDPIEVALDEALSIIDNGEIIDSKTVAGILRYERFCRHA